VGWGGGWGWGWGGVSEAVWWGVWRWLEILVCCFAELVSSMLISKRRSGADPPAATHRRVRAVDDGGQRQQRALRVEDGGVDDGVSDEGHEALELLVVRQVVLRWWGWMGWGMAADGVEGRRALVGWGSWARKKKDHHANH